MDNPIITILAILFMVIVLFCIIYVIPVLKNKLGHKIRDENFKLIDCFLQALFGQNCKTFLDIVACPNWTKLQSLGWPRTYQPRAIADII